MSVIVVVPADRKGNKLYLKELRVDNEHLFIKYRSTFNDIPFRETEIFPVDDSHVITGDDGTVIWRFPTPMLAKLIDD